MDRIRALCLTLTSLTALGGLGLVVTGCTTEGDRRDQMGTAGDEARMGYEETEQQREPRGQQAHMEQGPPGDLMLGPDGVDHTHDGITPSGRAAQGTMGEGMQGPMMGSPDQQRAQALGAVCPMLTARTQLRVEDIDQGIAMVFMTDAQEDVETLRSHVEHLASMPVWTQQGMAGMQQPGMQGQQPGMQGQQQPGMQGQQPGMQGQQPGMQGQQQPGMQGQQQPGMQGQQPGMQGQQQGMQGQQQGMQGQQPGQMDPTMQIPAATATAVPVPGGARLELRAQTPQQVDELRARTRMRAERLRTTECPMMQAAASR